MAVTHDYKCPKHGYFENTEARCIKKRCAEEVMLVFLQAPAIGSGDTKRIDKTKSQLAMDFNMTDMRSTKPGENQAGYFTRNNKTKTKVESKSIPAKPEPRPGDNAIWGGGQQGMNMKNILAGRYSRPVRDEPVGFIPKQGISNLTGPRAGSYIADHEGLTIPK
jgi:hypothetical protein